ncbi:type II toxin-antitoxin system VapC family toxin [Rhizobium ruizarguesonis]|uniref:type II toxin-antitoxin system VapC family toxin n=1 Tax=Rhizobium ruizarguesonis TaxID=2081791 RepID=UPI00102FBA6B|nr:type II toxin-antitoxin system VapC family toxin [Rhizobium ruizarguesonis]TBA24679.1 type II toxin-antitoxin system VapC family toxin [Rhizobium ruizarguesonis]
MTTFIDSSILISLIKTTEPNHQWSVNEFNVRKQAGPVVISDVVYSEVSVSMKDVAEINQVLGVLGVERYPGSDDALFSAGRAYHTYKKANKGPKTSLLPDFFVGADAHQEGAPLMTDNKRDFTKYFPNLVLIVPP